jgi:non-specific serine/threonine protein kinase
MLARIMTKAGGTPPDPDPSKPAPDDATQVMRRTGSGDLTGDVTGPITRHGDVTGPITGGRPAPAPTATEGPRDRIGSYPITAELGRGGMGVVYLAEDPRLKRPIAIKVLPQAVAGDREWLARFEREAQLLAALNHPNIATIHSLEEGGGLRFLTLEFIPGQNLSDLIAKGPLDIDTALATGRQIAAALEAAHKRGVVHLDIKPQNVRITPDDLVKVLDFGLARAISAESGHAGLGASEDGTVVGTLGYMSPEQVRGDALDHRTDLWAMGCVLYECLAGRAVFQGKTVREICEATVHGEPDWGALPPDLPPPVAQALTRSLAKRVEDRLANAADFRRAIEDGIQARILATLGQARLPGREAAPNNLPAQVTSFLGREKEQQELKELLGTTHLLTLSGMGGCGKTRLALEVARGAMGAYFDGTWLVELAPLANPQLLPQTVAKVLGLKEEPNRPLTDTIVAHLKAKNLLLLLDNCEHMLSASAELAAAILRDCPEVTILTASREGLGIAGEVIYAVPPLTTPSTSRTLSLEALGRVESVALFVERAKAVKPGFALTEANRTAVAEVCRRLDGIPFAIELAVARIKVMSAEEIANRLDDRFRLLTGGSRTALPRHQTLRALIDWSYENLAEHEAVLLRRFAVFAGGWTLDAAAVVGTAGDIEEYEVLDLVSRLLDKSLVEMDAEGGQRTGKTRYRMLETVKSYARERLKERDELEQARDRHLRFFLDLAEEAEPNLLGGEQGLWLTRLEVEHDNLRSAADTCVERPDDPNLGLRMAGALGRFWEVHGHWTEGRETCEAMVAIAGGDPAARAKVLFCEGNLALSQGDSAVARTAYEQSLAIRRELGDRAGIAQLLTSLGIAAWIRGEYAAARPLLEESLQIRREIGNKQAIAFTLQNLANLTRDQGDLQGARAIHEEALGILRQIGDRRSIATTANNLGHVVRAAGDLAQARVLYEEGLAIRRELEDRQGIARSLTSLAQLAKEEGDYGYAKALHVEGLAIKRELGDRRGVVVSLVNLAAVLTAEGNHEEALGLLRESLEIERSVGSKQVVAFLLRELGLTHRQLSHPAEARAHLVESLGLAVQANDRTGITETLEALALVAADRGDADRAAFLLGAAEAAIGGTGNARKQSPERTEAEALGRRTLADAAWAAALERGRTASLEQVVADPLGTS